MDKVLIIAEAGVNHNGSIELAKKLIDLGVSAGVDVVKFQTFKAEKLVTKSAKKADYQLKGAPSVESQFEMLKKLELSDSDFLMLKKYCQDKGVEFLSTAFDEESLNFLVHDVGIERIKIPSGEITNAPYVLNAARKKIPLILSTGMCSVSEIEDALDIIAFGFLNLEKPCRDHIKGKRFLPKAQEWIRSHVTILQCTTEYPTLDADMHLRVLSTYRKDFGTQVGLSDHSEGITASLGAVALRASVIEKHFTLDKSLPGPDHKASLDPDQLKQLVSEIRRMQTLLGRAEKSMTTSELKNLVPARKSLLAAREIKAGEVFTEDNIMVRRPGGGMSPLHYWDVLGKLATSDLKYEEAIHL
jgi:N-acetylneuraminate synthase